MKKILVALAVLLAVGGLLALPTTKHQNARAQDSTALYECIGRAVAKYMNDVIRLSGSRQHVKLASPVFNLTSQYSPIIFNAMVSANANFAALDGFAGNVYTIEESNGGKLAYDWYANEPHYDGTTWKRKFEARGKPVIFTEFGDFNTFETKPGERPELVEKMRREHNRTADDGGIKAIIYFNALGTNPSLIGHKLTDDEIRTITSGNRSKAGINSAARVNGSGDFPRRVRSVADLRWTSEIIYSPGDLDAAVAAANSATNEGMIAVLRPCDAQTCGLTSPSDLANFVRTLDSRVNGEVWVIAGPNEPDIERWASPQCGIGTFDCRTGDTDDREYHSLRPYPGCPWDGSVSQVALLCGHKLTIADQIKVKPGDGSCIENPDGSRTCTFKKARGVGVSIDLTQADLPIMGNTELVENGDPASPVKTKLAPEARVNDYVSWYLNGVINRAENRFPQIDQSGSTISKEDERKVVDLSGPLNKLLPLEVQWETRKQTVEAGGGSNPSQHDQIASCTYGIKIRFPPWPLPGAEYTIGGFPAPCYESGIAGALPRTVNRLSDWLKTIPPFNASRLPPYFSNPIFETFQDYYKAYQEWRGKLCAQFSIPDWIPGIPDFLKGKHFLLCGDDPGGVLAPNFWSNTHPYIPYSSTEDRVGYYSATAPSGLQTEDTRVTNITFNGVPKELYFAHMEEVAKLARLLQHTFAPQTYSDSLVNDISPLEIGDQCRILDTRSNPGDKLLPNPSDERIVKANLAYDVEFECKFPPAATCADRGGECKTSCAPDETNLGGPPLCSANSVCCAKNPIPGPDQTCAKTVVVPIDVATAVPLADEVWKRLVGGASSVFRRIYPQVGVGGVLKEIRDIPGSTIVSYSLTNTQEGQKIEGNPNELYLPHIGGLQEYFLRGIQKALRPKGLDSTIISGANTPPPSTQCTSLGYSIDDYHNPQGTQPQTAQNIYDRIKGEFPGNQVRSYYDRVVDRARAAGYNPAFVLAVWVEESGASDYTQFGNGVADLGCISSPRGNIEAQLDCFLGLYDFYSSSNLFSCRVGGAHPNFEDFMLFFSEGPCQTVEQQARKFCTNAAFPQRIQRYYNLVTQP